MQRLWAEVADASIFNMVQIAIVLIWFTRSVLKRRVQGRGFRNEPDPAAVTRLRALCFLGTLFVVAVWRVPNGMVESPQEDQRYGGWIGFTFLWFLFEEVSDAVHLCVVYPLQMWWNHSMIGVLSSFVQTLPSNLVSRQILTSLSHLALTMFPQSMWTRFWFILVPLMVAFVISTLALVFNLLTKFSPPLANRVWMMIHSETKLVRISLFSLGCLTLASDALRVLSAMDNRRETLRIAVFLVSGASILGVQSYKLLARTTVFNASAMLIGLLTVVLISYLDRRVMLGGSAYFIFWAVASESGVIPRSHEAFPAICGLTVLPLIAYGSWGGESSLTTAQTSSTIALQSAFHVIEAMLRLIALGVCLVGMFGTWKMTQEMENLILKGIDGALWFLLDVVLLNAINTFRRIARTFETILTRYLLPLLKTIWEKVLIRSMMTIRSRVLSPSKRLVRAWLERITRLLEWVVQNVIRPLVRFISRSLLATGRFMQDTVIAPCVGIGKSFIRIAMEAAMSLWELILVPFYQELAAGASWIAYNVVRRLLRASYLLAIRLRIVVLQLAAMGASYVLCFEVIPRMGNCDDGIPLILLQGGSVALGYLFLVVQRTATSGNSGGSTRWMSLVVIVVHWIWMLTSTTTWSDRNLFFGAFTLNRPLWGSFEDQLSLLAIYLACSLSLDAIRLALSPSGIIRFGDVIKGWMDLVSAWFVQSFCLETAVGVLSLLGSGRLDAGAVIMTLVRGGWGIVSLRTLIRSAEDGNAGSASALAKGIRTNRFGIGGIWCILAAMIDLGRCLTSFGTSSLVMTMTMDLIVVVYGLNLVGRQMAASFPRFSLIIRRPWFLMRFLGERWFALTRPMIALRVAIEMVEFSLSLRTYHSMEARGNGPYLLTRCLGLIVAFSLTCASGWMLGDAIHWSFLAEYSRRRFDSLARMVATSVETIWLGSRAMGRFTKKVGRHLLAVSLHLWGRLISPLIKTVVLGIVLVWNNPVLSWTSSLGMLVAIYAMNKGGLDAFILDAIYMVPSAMVGLMQNVPFGIMVESLIQFAWVGIEWSRSQMAEINFKSVLLSFPFLLLAASICVLGSHLRVHRHRRDQPNEDRWFLLAEADRIVSVPAVSVFATYYLLAPDILQPVLVVATLWAVLAMTAVVVDERERREVHARLTAMRQRRNANASGDDGRRQDPVNVDDILSKLPNPKDIVFESSECAICMDAMESGNDQSRFVLVCGHQFHRKCIATWLKDHTKCPLCRRSVTGDDQILQEWM